MVWTDDDERLLRVRAHKYSLPVERLRQMLFEGCIYPGGDHADELHIDHDHKCCGKNKSCGKCVRGILCGNHNRLVGMVEKALPHMDWIIEYRRTK